MSIGWISGAKGSILELFGGFSAKGRKVNSRTEKSTRGQPRLLSINESTWSPGSESQKNSGRLTKKPRSQAKSTMVNSEGQSPSQGQPSDSSRSFHGIMEYVRFGEVTHILFLPFVSHKILPLCPSFSLLGH